MKEPRKKPATRIIILEDHTAIREMMAYYIRSKPEYELLGDFGDGRAALQACLEQKPDVLISDLMMEGFSGMDMLQALHDQKALPNTLVFSAHINPHLIERCLKLGVLGYIEKAAFFIEFQKAIGEIAAGRTYLGPKVVAAMRRVVSSGVSATLTPRETDVLRLIALGRSSKEIADDLKISPGTVETHRANIARRTGLRSVAQFTLYAIELGLVEPKQNF